MFVMEGKNRPGMNGRVAKDFEEAFRIAVEEMVDRPVYLPLKGAEYLVWSGPTGEDEWPTSNLLLEKADKCTG